MSSLLLPLVASFPVLPLTQAAEDPLPTLTLETVEAGTLEEGGSDSYVLEAAAGEFVAGYAQQTSVDVIVRIYDPANELLEEFDGPAAGPEHFSFETETEGKYRIEVAAFEDEVGDYSLDLVLLEPIATSGAGRADQLMVAFTGEGTPGGVVVVVEKGKVLFEKAYGMANLTHAVPFSVHTPSNLGSTSKQFTAFAILMLQKEGKLSVDDDVRKHLPELPDFGETVTIRNLLTHTSGYREFLNTLAMAGRRLDEGDYIDRAEVLDVVLRQPELQNSPGSEFNYNNTGFGMLTVIVERVTGDSYPDWMKTNVFEPLGMHHTTVRSHPSELIPGSSQGYVPGSGGFRDSRDLGASMGAGGMYSTSGDMAKWMRNLQTGDLGGSELIAAMTTPFELTSGESTGYGFGMFVDEQNSLRRFHHGGADSAHRSMLIVYPEIESGVVALSNNANFNSSMIAGEIGEAFFGEHMKLEDTAKAVEASADKKTDFDPASYDPKDFDELAGRYELEVMPGFVLEFRREGDRLITQATGQQAIEIVPSAELTFTIQEVDAKVVFHRDDEGKISSLTLHQNGEHTAKRLTEEKWAPTADDLAKYCGRYFSEELETFYTIVVVEGELTLQHRRIEDATLQPSDEHVFMGPSMARLEFTVDDKGEATTVTASTGRTRGVKFERVP